MKALAKPILLPCAVARDATLGMPTLIPLIGAGEHARRQLPPAEANGIRRYLKIPLDVL